MTSKRSPVLELAGVEQSLVVAGELVRIAAFCRSLGILMRFTIGLLAVLCIANAVRSADPRAEEPGTLAQEYQKALKESGQVSPNFRDAKTDEERKKAVETTDQFARRFVKLAEKWSEY